MREELLHFVWKFGILPPEGLAATTGECLKIFKTGTLNAHSGPDFIDARIEINGQLWAGNVEIHLKSSDWYKHNHHTDALYNNVVLHVVWDDDLAVVRKDNTPIPALELRQLIPEGLMRTYRKLFRKNQYRFINCENELKQVNRFILDNWLERLYFEKLERKCLEVENAMADCAHNWEQMLFSLLLKNFGLNVNGQAFYYLSRLVDFGIIRRIGGNRHQLESLLFGLAGLLDAEGDDPYLMSLKKEFAYLKQLFGLTTSPVIRPDFARLRPANFPTLRLSQFASLYSSQGRLFNLLMSASRMDQVYELFEVAASQYWDTHYTFGKVSVRKVKWLSRPFIELLVINTLLPVKFYYSRFNGKAVEAEILSLLTELPSEKNKIISRFEAFGLVCENAMDSQAVLQLYQAYCRQNRCLDCAVGCRLLRGK